MRIIIDIICPIIGYLLGLIIKRMTIETRSCFHRSPRLLLFVLEEANSRVLVFLRVRIGPRQGSGIVPGPCNDRCCRCCCYCNEASEWTFRALASCKRCSVPIFSRGECVGVARNSVAWRHRAGVDKRSVVRDRSQLLNWFFDLHKRHECLT